MENTINLFTEKRSEFLLLKLHEAIDWEKYNLMFISHHSTAIEGSSLTTTESQLLLDEGITPKGKPFEHSQMERDHYNALMFVAGEAEEKRSVTPEFIRTVAARVMHGTGQEYHVPGGGILIQQRGTTGRLVFSPGKRLTRISRRWKAW